MSTVDKGMRDQTWCNDLYGSNYANNDQQLDTHLFQDCSSISSYFPSPNNSHNHEDFPNISLNEDSLPIQETKISNSPYQKEISSGISSERRTITELSSGSCDQNIRYTTSPLPHSPISKIPRTQGISPQIDCNFQPVVDNIMCDSTPDYSYQIQAPINIPVHNESGDLRTQTVQPQYSTPVGSLPQLEHVPPLYNVCEQPRRKSARLKGSQTNEKRQYIVHNRPYAKDRAPRKRRQCNSTSLNSEPPFGLNSPVEHVFPDDQNQSNLDYNTPPPLVQADPTDDRQPFVQIIEQPQPKALRFRYICEGRSAGSIPGVNSTPENKTFPTLKIFNYKGAAQVIVSCVTVDQPHRPHPHNLVGKEGCSDGICRVRVNTESMECSFSNLGIQCVKKKDVADALRKREKRQIDPFRTGFAHRTQPQNIDLNAVRLCFEVFLEGPEPGCFGYALNPIVSDPIYDKKATSDLTICRLSDCSCTVIGGREIILLCDKVNKDDIQIRFFEIRNKTLQWEAYGEFQASDVHKQMAIAFRTPKYRNLEIREPVTVYLELVQPSDRSRSEPRPFQYLPLQSDTEHMRNKMVKMCNPSIREDLCSLLGDVNQYLCIPEDKNSLEDPFSQCY